MMWAADGAFWQRFLLWSIDPAAQATYSMARLGRQMRRAAAAIAAFGVSIADLEPAFRRMADGLPITAADATAHLSRPDDRQPRA